jgi:hypothetical protein
MRRSSRLILPLLLVSLGLRVWLASGGGQGYWPDELMRYGDAQTAASNLLHGEWPALARELFGHPDHQLFRWVALPPALLDVWLGANPFRAAGYFSLISTALIWLVWRVARRAGAGEGEALLAALLAAGASSLFYYARHFFPYDASLCLMLWALELGWGPGKSGRCVATGAVVALGFLTYNGYWLLGGVVLVLHVFSGGREGRPFLRGSCAAAGFVLPLALMILAGQAAGQDIIAGFRNNAGTISQGDFGQGYRVIGEYLWHSEGGILLVWLGGLAAVGRILVQRRAEPRTWGWLGALVLLLAGLILLSDVWTKFVVYGRVVRELVPFLCLLAAHGLADWLARLEVRPRWRTAAVALFLTVGAVNFITPLRQVFPDRFRELAAREIRARAQRDYGVWMVVNAEHLWGKSLTNQLQGDVLVRRRHPLQFRPYQYEGFSLKERDRFNGGADISMRLVRPIRPDGSSLVQLPRGDPVWGDWPGPVRMEVEFPSDRRGLSEPLLTVGIAGRADFIYIRYEDDRHVRIGFDHWGTGGAISLPVEVDYNRPHNLVICAGALLPPDIGSDPTASDLAELRKRVVVMIDGRQALNLPMPTYDSPRATISLGTNIVGGSTTTGRFTGIIRRIDRADPAMIQVAAPSLFVSEAARSAKRGGAPGPFELQFTVMQELVNSHMPIACSGRPGAGDLLFAEMDRAGGLSLHLDHWGTMFNAPGKVRIRWGEPVTIGVFMGSFMPPPDAPFYQTRPALHALRDRLLVTVNGRVAWDQKVGFYPAQKRWAVGSNSIGASNAESTLRANVTGLRLLDLAGDQATVTETPGLLPPGPGRLAGYPGAIRLLLAFPEGRSGAGEPLLTTGVTGAGDFVFVRYVDERHIRIGLDHWGAGGPVGEPIEIEPGRVQELAISGGFLYPPAGSEWYRETPGAKELTEVVWVELNGRTIIRAPLTPHPSQPANIVFGRNLIGGSSSDRAFTGTLLQSLPLPEAELRAILQLPAK